MMKSIAPLCPSLLVATAHTMASIGGRMPREFIDRMRLRCGSEDGSWHTAFVHHVGYTSHTDPLTGYSSWPLPATASCAELAAFARREGILVEEPIEGDILLLWSASSEQFERAGIVVAVQPAFLVGEDLCFDCSTVEGQTTPRGAMNGSGVHRLERRIERDAAHRFIRWVELDPRNPPPGPAPVADRCIALGVSR